MPDSTVPHEVHGSIADIRDFAYDLVIAKCTHVLAVGTNVSRLHRGLPTSPAARRTSMSSESEGLSCIQRGGCMNEDPMTNESSTDTTLEPRMVPGVTVVPKSVSGRRTPATTPIAIEPQM